MSQRVRQEEAGGALMDPDVILEMLRSEVRKLEDQANAASADENLAWTAGEVADLFVGLDLFLSKGGALPRSWARAEGAEVQS